MDTLIQISEDNMSELFDRMMKRAIPKVITATREELSKLKPATWVKTPEALELLDLSRKTLEKLRIEDGDYVPGRIRCQIKSSRLFTWHSGDIKKYKHPETI